MTVKPKGIRKFFDLSGPRHCLQANLSEVLNGKIYMNGKRVLVFDYVLGFKRPISSAIMKMTGNFYCRLLELGVFEHVKIMRI